MKPIFISILGCVGLFSLNSAICAGDNSRELAAALSNLARLDQEVDMEGLARELRQPLLLNDAMKWFGPFGKMSTPLFRGAYDPPNSDLGITWIAVDWRLHRLGDKLGWLTTLEVSITPESCPTADALASAMGVKMFDSSGVMPDGGGRYATHTLTIKQQSGEPVYVQYFPGENCRISIARLREAY
jgi:hypothetical protein